MIEVTSAHQPTLSSATRLRPQHGKRSQLQRTLSEKTIQQRQNRSLFSSDFPRLPEGEELAEDSEQVEEMRAPRVPRGAVAMPGMGMGMGAMLQGRDMASLRGGLRSSSTARSTASELLSASDPGTPPADPALGFNPGAIRGGLRPVARGGAPSGAGPAAPLFDPAAMRGNLRSAASRSATPADQPAATPVGFDPAALRGSLRSSASRAITGGAPALPAFDPAALRGNLRSTPKPAAVAATSESKASDELENPFAVLRRSVGSSPPPAAPAED